LTREGQKRGIVFIEGEEREKADGRERLWRFIDLVIKEVIVEAY